MSLITMYICICNAVTENQIRSAVESGASCMRQLGTELGVGVQCGSCRCAARNILEELGAPPRSRTEKLIT